MAENKYIKQVVTDVGRGGYAEMKSLILDSDAWKDASLLSFGWN